MLSKGPESFKQWHANAAHLHLNSVPWTKCKAAFSYLLKSTSIKCQFVSGLRADHWSA